jgi:hypothetical protein
MLIRRVISHLIKSIAENTNEEVENFDHYHGSRFWQYRIYEDGGV